MNMQTHPSITYSSSQPISSIIQSYSANIVHIAIIQSYLIPHSSNIHQSNLDIASRIEPVQLIDQLQHRPLHLVVPASAVVEAGATDSVDLVKEDDAGLLGAGQLEQFSHHAGALADVFLDELAADDPDEAGVGAVGDSAGTQRLAGARRAE